uniref:Uncharacterized protein n=1 Tax=Mastacembelus armatus TaxID=205130 RepID=A0A7N8X2K4_9TELE
MGAQEQKDEAASSVQKKQQKTSKEVYFSVLPNIYEPLIEEEEEEREETAEEKRKRKEEKKAKKKHKYKKYRKVRTGANKFLYRHTELSRLTNVGKALRFSWHCLMTGLQSMTSAYSMPLAVATVTTGVNQAAGVLF